MIGYVLAESCSFSRSCSLPRCFIWAMIYAVPGGPIGVIVGENATQEQIDAATKQFGLDRPVLVQYGGWLNDALLGDLGVSIHSRQPVLHLIGSDCRPHSNSQLPRPDCASSRNPVAIGSAIFPNSWLDRILGAWSALALGVPTFWLGILLILLFAVELSWLPSASGYVPFWESRFR